MLRSCFYGPTALSWLLISQCCGELRALAAPLVDFYLVSSGKVLQYEKLIGVLGNGSNHREPAVPMPMPLVLLLHGLGGSYDSPCNEEIATGLLERGGLSVVVADYEAAVEGPEFAQAAKNVGAVGEAVARFLIDSQRFGTVSLGTTTLIGFSLGAHVAGVVGHRLQSETGSLGRIVGLDPARPVFIDLSAEEKLDSSDADFVMAIHTAGGFLGIESPIGHADFYPNGGKEIQPHCASNELSTHWRVLVAVVCSHQAACGYLAESIGRQSFVAAKCSSWEDYQTGLCDTTEKVFMGFDTDSSVRGIFFLRTTREPSFGSWEDASSGDNELATPVVAQYHYFPRSLAPSVRSPLLVGLLASASLLLFAAD